MTVVFLVRGNGDLTTWPHGRALSSWPTGHEHEAHASAGMTPAGMKGRPLPYVQINEPIDHDHLFDHLAFHRWLAPPITPPPTQRPTFSSTLSMSSKTKSGGLNSKTSCQSKRSQLHTAYAFCSISLSTRMNPRLNLNASSRGKRQMIRLLLAPVALFLNDSATHFKVKGTAEQETAPHTLAIPAQGRHQ